MTLYLEQQRKISLYYTDTLVISYYCTYIGYVSLMRPFLQYNGWGIWFIGCIGCSVVVIIPSFLGNQKIISEAGQVSLKAKFLAPLNWKKFETFQTISASNKQFDLRFEIKKKIQQFWTSKNFKNLRSLKMKEVWKSNIFENPENLRLKFARRHKGYAIWLNRGTRTTRENTKM